MLRCTVAEPTPHPRGGQSAQGAKKRRCLRLASDRLSQWRSEEEGKTMSPLPAADVMDGHLYQEETTQANLCLTGDDHLPGHGKSV